MRNLGPITVNDTELHELARVRVPMGMSTWQSNIRVDDVEPKGWSETVAALGATMTIERTEGGCRVVSASVPAASSYACTFEATEDGLRVMVATRGEPFRFYLVWLRQLDASNRPLVTYGDADMLADRASARGHA